MLITIDEYYDVKFYKECLQALSNNGIKYKEYISLRSPYNWYLEIDSLPIMVNYDIASRKTEKFIVNKVEPALPNEAYLLQRRIGDIGKKALPFYAFNDPLNKVTKSDYACFFNVSSKEQLERLSKQLGEIYYFGRYYHNKFKIGLCYNKMIKNFINVSDILVEKNSTVTQMELDLNWDVFKLQDRLRKFTQTPSFKDGKFQPVKIKQFNFTF